MKKAEEVMEILEAYDLAGTLRGVTALAGCDHNTVAHWVRQRELAGGMPAAGRRKPAVGDFAGKIDELVERSHGRIRADVAHDKLVALAAAVRATPFVLPPPRAARSLWRPSNRVGRTQSASRRTIAFAQSRASGCRRSHNRSFVLVRPRRAIALAKGIVAIRLYARRGATAGIAQTRAPGPRPAA